MTHPTPAPMVLTRARATPERPPLPRSYPGSYPGANPGAPRRTADAPRGGAPEHHGYTMGPGAPPRRPAPLPWPHGADPAHSVTARLEEAGATLLALPHTGYTTSLRLTRLDTINPGAEPPACSKTRARAPMPSTAAITRMDEAFAWFHLIPDDRFVLRRILGARALVHPLTGRHIHSWRKLATLIGADHNAVRRWHGEAIALLVRALRAGCPHRPGS